MNTTKITENLTKTRLLQKIVDISIIVLFSVIVLSIYENYWTAVHISQKNMSALHFDMFSTYYTFVFILFVLIIPYFIDFICNKTILNTQTDKKQTHSKLTRFMKILLASIFVILLSVAAADRYSRVEFYDNGNIIEYNRQNQILNEYNKDDIEVVELRTNHNSGKSTTYWTEAIIRLQNKNYLIQTKDFIAPDTYEINSDTARSLYGINRIKETFSDKIKINTENIDILLQVEWVNYTQQQAKELCRVFEVDYESISAWLKEEWDIVIKE